MKKFTLFMLCIAMTSFLCAQDFVWAKQQSGTGSESGVAIALDNAGNVLTTGVFQGTVDFDPGPGVVNLTSAGADDIFVSKVSSTGALIWVKRIGGTNFDGGTAIAADNAGNVYIVGGYIANIDPVDFDPGAGTFNLFFGGGFVLKLNSIGDFVWAFQYAGGSGGIQDVAVDGSGNVYITGDLSSFGFPVDFDPSNGTYKQVSVTVMQLLQNIVLMLRSFGQKILEESAVVHWVLPLLLTIVEMYLQPAGLVAQ